MLYGLGMGGYDQVITRMLSAAWNMLAVPFYFRVVHPERPEEPDLSAAA